jgi:hypothetical protein
MNIQPNPERAADLVRALEAYRWARQKLLAALHLPASNRDPLAEFSEHLVGALIGASLASSRVQPGHDLVRPDGSKIQVRYLANPEGAWVNEHEVRQIPGVEWYALVLFEAFAVVGVLAIPTDRLALIGRALAKRHPSQHETLQFTRRNLRAIQDSPNEFRALGLLMWFPPFD